MNDNLVLVNANIVTMNGQQPHARAVAVRDGRIAAVGSLEDVRSFRDGSRTIDLNGKTILPGLIDSHVHFTSTGIKAMALDLSSVSSVAEAQEILLQAHRDSSARQFIYGMGINHYRLPQQKLPGLDDLDHAVPDRPIFILGATGHNALVNSACLKTLDLPKQVMAFYADGCVRGEALSHTRRRMRSQFVRDHGLKTFQQKAADMALKVGLTTVHALEGDDRPDDPDIVSLLEIAPGLPLRIVTWYQTLDIDSARKYGLKRIGGCILLDGDFGPHTAAMLQPYADQPGNSGVLYYTQAKINQFVEKAHLAGLQVAMHAVGDRAAEQALNAYERALEKWPKDDHRHRIEHFEIYDPALVQRVLKSGIHLGIQPPFNHHFGGHNRLDTLLGPKRALRSDPLKSLLTDGIPAGGGSDSYVTPMNPVYSIHCAVNHSIPGEKLDVESAIRLYTLDNARLSFEENEKGSIETGKLADLTILDRNPTRIEPEAIKEIRVEMTVIGGEIVYTRF